MSKVIMGVAELGAAAGLVVAANFVPGGGQLLTPFILHLVEGLALSGASMLAGAAASALTSNRGMTITTRQPAANRQIIYGTNRVGGVFLYRSTTGSHKDQENYVIVLAGHRCDAIVNLYLDGRQVFWQQGSVGNQTHGGINFGGNPDGNDHIGPNGQKYNFGGKLYCHAYYGDQTAATGFDGGLYANDPVWGPSDKGIPYVGGCTYVYLKLEADVNVFPGDPEIRFTINGKNDILDPRTGQRGFTTNRALIVADVISDPQFGLGDPTVNQAQLIVAANVCDEQVPLAAGGTESRDTCNYHYDTGTSPGDVLITMVTETLGRLSQIGGEWFYWPRYWQGPSFTFDQNALTGPIQWNPYRSASDLVNRVTGTYIAPNYPYSVIGNAYDANGYDSSGQTQNNFGYGFQPTNFPQYAADTDHGYASDEYLNEDVGILRPKEITLRTVLSVAQAQRIAKGTLLDNRRQGTGSFPMSLAAWRMQPGDVFQFTFPEYGWTEKLLEVTDVVFAVTENDGDQNTPGVPSIGVVVSVRETAASDYDDLGPGEEQTIYDAPVLPQNSYVPAPPTNLVLTSGAGTALQLLDGSVHPRIMVQWDTPEDILTNQIQVQYSTVANPTVWLDNGLVDVSNNITYINNVIAGAGYNVRIRGLRANGAQSPWAEIDGYTVSITLSVLGIVSLAPGSLIADAYSDATGQYAEVTVQGFTAMVGNASVAVLPNGATVLIQGLLQQQLYYIYYVDLNFTGGAITPIATQNSSDFLNKPGYFLIDSIITPYAAPVSGSGGGSGGGTPTGTRYAPSNYQDAGTRTTASPANAYDGDTSTAATVSGTYTYVESSGGSNSNTVRANAQPLPPGGGGSSRSSFGLLLYEDWPSVTTSAATSLTLVAAYRVTGQGSPQVIVTGNIGNTSNIILTESATTASATYTMAIPSGTDLSTVSLQVNVTPDDNSSTSNTGIMSVYEIYIQ